MLLPTPTDKDKYTTDSELLTESELLPVSHSGRQARKQSTKKERIGDRQWQRAELRRYTCWVQFIV